MDYTKLLLNPARLRILQCAKLHGEVTAAQLSAMLNDIPRATLYHHVKLLEQHGLLVTVAEKKVRGATEKLLSPAAHAPISGSEQGALATALSADLLCELEAYFSRPDAAPEQDRIFAQKGVLTVTDEEYDTLLREMKAALCKVLNLPKTPMRRQRHLSFISTFPLQVEEGDAP